MLSIFLPHDCPYPRSDAVPPGGFPEPSPGHAAIGTGEPQFQLSPVGSGQKLEPKTVRLWQAAVHAGQPSPGTTSRWWGRREGAATFSIHVHIPQVRVILQRNRLTAWREPVPLGQHGIARSEVVRPNGRELSSKMPLWFLFSSQQPSRSLSLSPCCTFFLPRSVFNRLIWSQSGETGLFLWASHRHMMFPLSREESTAAESTAESPGRLTDAPTHSPHKTPSEVWTHTHTEVHSPPFLSPPSLSN